MPLPRMLERSVIHTACERTLSGARVCLRASSASLSVHVSSKGDGNQGRVANVCHRLVAWNAVRL
eukprot:3301808-Alexandrium_andersonii.AAC.1